MDATFDCTAQGCLQEPSLWSRRGVAEKMAQFESLDSPWTSPRRIAGQLDVSARTLHHGIRRERTLIGNSSWPKRVARFLKTPEGLDFLQRLFTAAHLVFVEAHDCGLRNLSWFLELSGLDEFIAPSYGAQQAVAEELESRLSRFGQEEDQRLAEQMPPREITLCEDETFHPQICLVALEPVSNFILVEQYQPQRDAETWQQCALAKLAALPVSVCQVSSDAAKAGLSAHARDKLAKARRVLDSLQATLAFFWTMIAPRLAAWGFSAVVQQWLRQDLIPAYYLGRVAEKADTAQERQRLRTLAAEVLARARSPDGLWGTFSPDLQTDLESKARQCADFFPRSSSCVEGRNGQLSLRHHALHQLTGRKWQALTVLHNCAVQRADGSTAAGRFYGATP